MQCVKADARFFLFFSVIAYLFVIALHYSGSLLPGGVDSSAHLYQIWFIKEYGMAAWNPYWYTGSPLLDQYPPLSHMVSALFASFLGVVDAYKLVNALGLLLLPLCFWYYLKELKLTDYEKSVSILLFSFSVIFVHYYEEGVFSALTSFPLVILYFKFLQRVVNAGRIRNVLLSTAFLGLCLVAHALNPVYAILFSFLYMVFLGRKRIKEFAAIVFISVLLSVWFWVPYALNYGAPGAGTSGFNPLVLFESLGRSFIVSVNYFGMFFMALFLFMLAYILLTSLLARKRMEHSLFIISFLLVIILLPLIPFFGLGLPEKTLLYVPFFLSVYVSRGMSGMKHRSLLAALLVTPMILLFITHPAVGVKTTNNDIPAVMSYVRESAGTRFNFIPSLFDLMTENKSYEPADEHMIAPFLVPYMTGKEVLNGWWDVGELTIGRDKGYVSMISYSCNRRRSYAELLSTASYVNMNLQGSRDVCRVKLDAERYCDLARQASLDYIVVNRWFPELEEYVGKLDCVTKEKEFEHFTFYKVTDTKPYISFSEASAYEYSKKPGIVVIEFQSQHGGSVTVNVTESYMRQWNAYLDGVKVPVKRSAYGFISLELDVSSGKHSLRLEYVPERYGNFFTYVSAITWVALLFAIVLTCPRTVRRRAL